MKLGGIVVDLKLGQLKSLALGAFAGSMLVTGAAFAQSVTLTVQDGSVVIAGQLQSYEDGFYVLETTLGTMRIAAARVTCEGEACPQPPEIEGIVIAGSETIGSSLVPLLLTGFAAVNGGAMETENVDGNVVATLLAEDGFGDSMGTYTVSSSTSTTAFEALIQGNADIGMSSRRVTPNEARLIAAAGGGNIIANDQEHVVAVDSLVVVVNQANPISQISIRQLDGIYSGQITNWSQLGGRDEPIIAYTREVGSGTRDVFEDGVFAATGNRPAGGLQVATSNEEMASAVNSQPNAIGFVGFAFVRGAKELNLVGECGLVSRPDAFAAKAEEYPLQRRLYLYNRADNVTDIARTFLDYSISADADRLVAKAGFVDLGVQRIPQDNTNTGRIREVILGTVEPAELPLMRELVVDFIQYDRLSSTFRFASGSSSLEAKALLDLERLVNYLNQATGNIEISFIGFSDSDGSFNANQQLSLGRAQQVASAFQQYAAGRVGPNVRITTKGYGELAPAACNDSLEGKQINRRVEVWLRKLG